MKLKTIPSHPAYSVDQNGNVYGKTGKKLKLFSGANGYLRFTTFEDGKWQQVSVHVMMCEAFYGPRPQGMHAAHANGIRKDNRICNLSWKTASENEADKRLHGLALLGERHHQHKLTTDEVLSIRASSKPGVELAQLYGVTPTTISYIRRRKTWRHI